MVERDGVSDGLVSDRSLEMVTQVAIGAPLSALPRAEAIASQFEAAISIGVLASGDRLPPESVLAEHMGVSPLTMRQGLGLLRSKGLAETRRGRGGGSYISGQVEVRDTDIERRLRGIGTSDLRDIFDLADTAARGAVRLSAQRADDQHLQRLRARNRSILSDESPTSLRRAYCLFHIGLGIAAQSQQLTSLLVRTQAQLAPIAWSTEQVGARRAEIFEEHAAVIDAIEKGDASLAETRVSSHFEAEKLWAVSRHLSLFTTEVTHQ